MKRMAFNSGVVLRSPRPPDRFDPKRTMENYPEQFDEQRSGRDWARRGESATALPSLSSTIPYRLSSIIGLSANKMPNGGNSSNLVTGRESSPPFHHPCETRDLLLVEHKTIHSQAPLHTPSILPSPRIRFASPRDTSMRQSSNAGFTRRRPPAVSVSSAAVSSLAPKQLRAVRPLSQIRNGALKNDSGMNSHPLMRIGTSALSRNAGGPISVSNARGVSGPHSSWASGGGQPSSSVRNSLAPGRASGGFAFHPPVSASSSSQLLLDLYASSPVSYLPSPMDVETRCSMEDTAPIWTPFHSSFTRKDFRNAGDGSLDTRVSAQPDMWLESAAWPPGVSGFKPNQPFMRPARGSAASSDRTSTSTGRSEDRVSTGLLSSRRSSSADTCDDGVSPSRCGDAVSIHAPARDAVSSGEDASDGWPLKPRRAFDFARRHIAIHSPRAVSSFTHPRHSPLSASVDSEPRLAVCHRVCRCLTFHLVRGSRNVPPEILQSDSNFLQAVFGPCPFAGPRHSNLSRCLPASPPGPARSIQIGGTTFFFPSPSAPFVPEVSTKPITGTPTPPDLETASTMKSATETSSPSKRPAAKTPSPSMKPLDSDTLSSPSNKPDSATPSSLSVSVSSAYPPKLQSATPPSAGPPAVFSRGVSENADSSAEQRHQQGLLSLGEEDGVSVALPAVSPELDDPWGGIGENEACITLQFLEAFTHRLRHECMSEEYLQKIITNMHLWLQKDSRSLADKHEETGDGWKPPSRENHRLSPEFWLSPQTATRSPLGQIARSFSFRFLFPMSLEDSSMTAQ
eukprot:Gregarina_sp_Poly_1__3529@NODE_202_length_11519_cov_188_798463_g180_i0_p2_GENE_NODE_202_length_11519_cov_188_798463_g180_i0NODE_202_length_11519_cov_188_798463_g180_i0_p2_ORF_typecomplete_len796_score120_36_NODE_202_length_11519_cov_188_798463_g180_i020614448